MKTSDQWEVWKAEARKLPYADLARHASVSINNRHECKECFTCACADVKYELARAYVEGIRQ